MYGRKVSRTSWSGPNLESNADLLVRHLFERPCQIHVPVLLFCYA